MANKRLAHGLLLAMIAGCTPSTVNLPVADPVPQRKLLSSAFEKDRTGVLSGSVNWTMPADAPAEWYLPQEVPTVRRPVGDNKTEEILNPNRMTIKNGNVHGAVVMLRGVDPAKSKPWPHGPVEVQLTDRGIVIHQDGEVRREGFVKAGDTVTIRMTGDRPLGLRGRGDDFFSHMLTANARVIERKCDKTGRIELMSSSGQFWAAATLFVVDSPYITRTDAAGVYRFDDVPAGEYDWTAYHPNWNVERREIDPESGLPVRHYYAKPFQAAGRVNVVAGSRTIHNAIMNEISP